VKEALRLVAPLTGAALYAVVGGGGVAILDGVTFVAAAIALGALRVREPAPERAPSNARTELVAGIRFLWRARPLLHVTIALALALLVIGIAESVVFAIVEYLGKPPEFVGVVVAVQGIGAVIGGFVAAWLIKVSGEVRTVIVGLASFALGAAVMIVTWLPVVTVGVVLAGFGLPLVLVGFVTVLQRTATGPLVGRVTTAAQLVIGVPQTVSVALGALLVSVLDFRVLLAVMAGGTLLAVGYLAVADGGGGARSGSAAGPLPPAPIAPSAAALVGGTVPAAMSASRAMGWTVPRSPGQGSGRAARPVGSMRELESPDETVGKTRTGTPP
jgi:Na+/melibiose symporter-like transporter